MAKRRKEPKPSSMVVGYVRVSSAAQAESGAGLDAQRAIIEAEAARRGWTLLHIYEDAGVSGSSKEGRPDLARALEALDSKEADTLVVSRMDRLARSTVDAANLLARAEEGRWNLVALDLGVDNSTPNGQLVAAIMAAIAQWEARTGGQRTKEALLAKRARGERIGRPQFLPDDVIRRIVVERAAGLKSPAIAQGLNDDGVPTGRGGRQWWPATVRAVLGSQAAERIEKELPTVPTDAS